MLLLAACGGGPAESAAPSTDTTVDVRLVLEPTSLDLTTVSGAALEQLLLDNVYQGLLTRSPTGEVVPLLAREVQTSADGLTYTFPLKPNLTFADGSPLTAADVVWSYQRVLAPDSRNPNKKDFAAVAGVSAPDPNTVVLTLSKRDANLTYALTNRAGAVYKTGTDPASLAATTNGSGPYTVAQWNRGSTITLARNENYWGEKAKVASVVLHYIPDPNAANNAQLTGETDVETAVLPTLVSTFAGREGLRVAEGITSDKFVLGFNNSRGPLADQRVRSAIRQAIDKKGLLTILGGAGQVIGSGVAPTDPWFSDLTAIDPYDPEAAKRLLAEAGVGSGLTLSLQVPNIYPETIGTYVASQLAQVGITVNVQPVEFATWLDKVFTQADYDLSIVDHAEARDIANYANPQYYWRYDSPVVQDLVARAGTAASDRERDDLYKQAARQISEDAASDWLYNPGARTVIRDGVEGFPTSSTSSRLDLSALSATESS
ncbi:Dipeptide-binding ABC transporter, periplasmic substrate-binding component [Pseudonocardia sp. Ae406_Ps2]|nr:Dipeptide-binding ABC transporter, periplasmic substrate-binding component [Pseudonocardia sp. Ae406_Ps2]OLM06906.1 Dipeptide-binding ABC transporter, periplasmic substrate-binding component [Pseudonocardia sp. Ae331_Ps2]OLM22870.1 Dipeptide-binding ABC transporter, periplasmic substrate-binding component [Pseudonocardia sp. Ae706_Ps2]